MTQEQKELVENNVKLAYWMINKFSARDDADMQSAAMLALINAALYYDRKKGTTFATFARTLIARALNYELRCRRGRRSVDKVVLGMVEIAEDSNEDNAYVPMTAPIEHDFLADDLMKRAVKNAMRKLPRMHRSTIEQRFGVGGVRVRTQAVIARAMNRSRERVRQIQYEGMYYLKQLFAGVETPELLTYNDIPKAWLLSVRHCVQIPTEEKGVHN